MVIAWTNMSKSLKKGFYSLNRIQQSKICALILEKDTTYIEVELCLQDFSDPNFHFVKRCKNVKKY